MDVIVNQLLVLPKHKGEIQENTNRIKRLLNSKNFNPRQNDGFPDFPVALEVLIKQPVGFGMPEKRHQAFKIINNRNYLSPKSCKF